VEAVLSVIVPIREIVSCGAIRQAVNSIGNQKNHELTPFFKRIGYKKGRIAAVTATTRKLSTIIWNMITKSDQNRIKEMK
jgi:transposase